MTTSKISAAVAAGFLVTVCATAPAFAQGFGEQAPMQFRYAGQGLTNAVYSWQLGASAGGAAASASAGSGASNPGQVSSQLSNVIQVYNNQTYNVGGTGNYLNIDGTTINGTQTSSGTSQSSSNAKTNDISVSQPGSTFLNK